jgi:peptide/nickel transport system permease protein
MAIIAIMIFLAIFAAVVAPYGYQEQIYSDAYQPPGPFHLFGTDNYGRDIFSRCVYGARYSLVFALACMMAAFLSGGTLGVIAGYFGGKTDNLIMRCMDVLQAIPQVLLAISIAASLGNGIPQMIAAITISAMPVISKNCRAAILNVKNAEYVESSRAIGVGQARMIVKHMIPNAVGVIIIFVVGLLGASINMMASLSYLGIGISPPTPEWGLILSGSKSYFTSHPYMVLFPALMIMLTCLAFNMLGDGLRDALDPRLK